MLRPKRKGRRREMTKPIGNILDILTLSNDNTEYIKQLQDELLKLKIEKD